MITCAITMGDPAGIGPEIILKALHTPQIQKIARFIVIGDKATLYKMRNAPARHGGECGMRNCELIDFNNVPRKNFAFGRVRAKHGKASMEYLDAALKLIREKKADCLVTAPINKEAIRLAGYKTAGHTGYIAKYFRVKNPVMMLFNDKIKVALITQHIPLRDIPKNLNRKKIIAIIRNTHAGLKSCFGIKNPHLGCCGLNPHASDNGTIGDEERRIINPAINIARIEGINIDNAVPADTIFIPNKKTSYDAIICMYHDQGLIPLKISGLSNAVNITLGLPFIRTSPSHGTAFDIAGKNIADPSSMILAIKSAIQCTKNLKKI